MKPEPDKHIVSRGEYVRKQAERAILAVCGMIICLPVVYCIAQILQNLGEVIKLNRIVSQGRGTGWEGYGFLICYFLMLIFGCLICVACFGARYFSKEVAKINPGIPLTHVNIADLPASGSLVRASQEPLQAQETVLLRVATETTESRAEQLLRALGKQEKP